jgi:hypothetical protein
MKINTFCRLLVLPVFILALVFEAHAFDPPINNNGSGNVNASNNSVSTGPSIADLHYWIEVIDLRIIIDVGIDFKILSQSDDNIISEDNNMNTNLGNTALNEGP